MFLKLFIYLFIYLFPFSFIETVSFSDIHTSFFHVAHFHNTPYTVYIDVVNFS